MARGSKALLFCVAACLLAFPQQASALADYEYVSDAPSFRECIKKASADPENASKANDEAACIKQERSRIEEEMNNYYRIYMDKYDSHSEQAKGMANVQTLWRQYRDAKCHYDTSFDSAEHKETMYDICIIRLTLSRADELGDLNDI